MICNKTAQILIGWLDFLTSENEHLTNHKW